MAKVMCEHLSIRSHTVYDGKADCVTCGEVVPIHIGSSDDPPENQPSGQ